MALFLRMPLDVALLALLCAVWLAGWREGDNLGLLASVLVCACKCSDRTARTRPGTQPIVRAYHCRVENGNNTV